MTSSEEANDVSQALDGFLNRLVGLLANPNVNENSNSSTDPRLAQQLLREIHHFQQQIIDPGQEHPQTRQKPTPTPTNTSTDNDNDNNSDLKLQVQLQNIQKSLQDAEYQLQKLVLQKQRQQQQQQPVSILQQSRAAAAAAAASRDNANDPQNLPPRQLPQPQSKKKTKFVSDAQLLADIDRGWDQALQQEARLQSQVDQLQLELQQLLQLNHTMNSHMSNRDNNQQQQLLEEQEALLAKLRQAVADFRNQWNQLHQKKNKVAAAAAPKAMAAAAPPPQNQPQSDDHTQQLLQNYQDLRVKVHDSLVDAQQKLHALRHLLGKVEDSSSSEDDNDNDDKNNLQQQQQQQDVPQYLSTNHEQQLSPSSPTDGNFTTTRTNSSEYLPREYQQNNDPPNYLPPATRQQQQPLYEVETVPYDDWDNPLEQYNDDNVVVDEYPYPYEYEYEPQQQVRGMALLQQQMAQVVDYSHQRSAAASAKNTDAFRYPSSPSLPLQPNYNPNPSIVQQHQYYQQQEDAGFMLGTNHRGRAKTGISRNNQLTRGRRTAAGPPPAAASYLQQPPPPPRHQVLRVGYKPPISYRDTLSSSTISNKQRQKPRILMQR